METDEIKKILASHADWLKNLDGGNRADLSRANLSDANLSMANLSVANLSRADLSGADLFWANLSGANLFGADLFGANLSRANLSDANLSMANLLWANLSRADLSCAKLSKLPSIKMLSSLNLGDLSDKLTLELMRRDAWAHPHPELFDQWAKGGDCPYKNEDRFWLFDLKKELWSPGPPEMRDSDLILEICRAKGIKVSGYLD